MPKPSNRRPVRLTSDHVARVTRPMPDLGPDPRWVFSTDEDHDATFDELMRSAPSDGEIWIFAYGSLIWRPDHDFVETRKGVLRGWHRSFCLGWNTRYRACEEFPGLMLALDRGGSCSGVLFRLPPDASKDNLLRLFKREMRVKPSSFPPRWVTVMTAEGPVRAITFAIDRSGPRYVGSLPDDQVAESLATAVGHFGSMAEYLYQTVAHLEQLGIHDSYLWRLQEMVADRIDRMEAATI